MSEDRKVLFPTIASRVPQGLVWKYEIVVRGGHEEHTWALIGPRGGIHVSAWDVGRAAWRDDPWMGGIEGHSPTPRDYEHADKPSHDHCWLIGKPCWHDGSSLQFSEQVGPYLSPPGNAFTAHDHEIVLGIMLDRYRTWLPEEAACASTTAAEGEGA